MISYLPHPLAVVFIAAGVNYDEAAGVICFALAGAVEVLRAIVVANTTEEL